jgi:5-hydroxyisourate hydrolase
LVQIVAEVLDSTYGQSGAGVRARLNYFQGDCWKTVASAETDHVGRIEGWGGHRVVPGLYNIVFESDGYFSTLGINSAYPEVSIIFRVADESDAYQVYVVIAPCAFSVYLGTPDTRLPNVI